jgi:hypothetical protein
VSDSLAPLAWLSSLEGVPSAYAAARDGIDAVLRDRGMRRTTPTQTADSLLLGAHASAVLSGSESSFDDVQAGNGDEVARAAVGISAALLSLVPVISTAPLQALARLDVLAGGEGRPTSAEGAARLQSVGSLLTSSVDTPALLVAAIVHADLVAAAPFAERSGLVARAAERLVLAARGVDPKSLIVPEAGHLALRPAYESNLRGYRDGGRAGVHAWCLYAAEAYAAGAEASPVR